MFTLEDVECIAACTEAPALQVNYRYFHRIDAEAFDRIIDDLRSGELASTVPAHGTLGKVRQDLEGDRIANVTAPEDQGVPSWIERAEAAADGGGDS
jgi:NADH-quinone oxidoreductase subunit E